MGQRDTNRQVGWVPGRQPKGQPAVRWVCDTGQIWVNHKEAHKLETQIIGKRLGAGSLKRDESEPMGLLWSGEGFGVTFSFLQLLSPMLFMEDSFPSTPCGCCCCSRWICSRIFRASWMAFITVSWSPNRAGELRLDRISAYIGCVIRGVWGQSLECWLWPTPQGNTVFSEQGGGTFVLKKTTTLIRAQKAKWSKLYWLRVQLGHGGTLAFQAGRLSCTLSQMIGPKF